ncbi:MAG TPA: S8 family serine peptidase [Solirubrobacteraceae bacterium]
MDYVEPAGQGGAVRFWVLAGLCWALVLAVPSMAAATPAAPLPESDYTTHSACAAPAPARAGCMALELVAKSPAARAQAANSSAQADFKTAAECKAEFPSACLTPLDLRSAYFPGETAQAPATGPQTIALVDAYNDPKAEADLSAYSSAFPIPALHKCAGSESDCFEQVSQTGTGQLPFPKNELEREAKETVCVTEKANENEAELERRIAACDELEEAEGWTVETSTDIEMAHAVCQNCKILLVEASIPSYRDLEKAEEEAVELGATEISNSWGGPQEGSNGSAFDHPGTVIAAAAGDDGYLNWTGIEAAEKATQEGRESGYFAGADYPAASPDVVAVGGTKLTMSQGTRRSESVWNEDPSPENTNQGAGGGGCSLSFAAQPWQQAVPDWSQVGCGSQRAVADVSADADPYTGVAIYDSVPSVQEEPSGKLVNKPLGWWPIGGTSVASPIVASMFALAGGSHHVEYPAQTLYSHLGSSLLHDVTTGGNGACNDVYSSCSGSMEPLSPLDCGSVALICKAAGGYDGPTGIGTPNGLGAFEPSEEGKQQSKPAEQEGANGGGESGGSSIGGSSSGAVSEAGKASPGTDFTAGPGAGKTPAPRISALTLTARARAAVRHGRPAISNLDFSFSSSRATSVKVTLAIQTRSAHGVHWRTLHHSLRFAAIRGVNRRRLHGSGTLTAGTYRLTLTPLGGTARTLTIRVL